ncbi:4-hydroxybenzoate octaprenyltransferase [Candidatus Palibaumannia cicadellinicola]|uniref:4-hydroxybenzoate octaprenyltransferase n=1 Tax=Candidatus Palibaumannia cicadellinicola TaxID=186490 RepID=A0A088N0Q8_9GAMM|nr:4-hydroxybenzoate octaprenyltransferase [Candidatus Baumannia cicadellinicola]AIN46911.1 4-hydroxybenzoate polyprenyltransferase [Candidatus Baumannia cicadellinicola]
MLDQPIKQWCQLMRIDKPIGLLLLLWPTLWALWLASNGFPHLSTLTVFILGVFFMRSAGCVINDFADRQIDGYVKRTRCRPLPSGTVREREAKLLFVALISVSLALVLTLNTMTIALSVVALALAFIYPFMKRYTYLPQLVLGIAFSWSIPMAFISVRHCLPVCCWLLFLANITWTIAYDTQYAMVDRDDDLRIGVKSTAIFFGRFDRLMIGLSQTITLFLLGIIGWQMALGYLFYIALVGVSVLFAWQQKLMNCRNRQAYFQAFLNNNYVGMLIFIGILLS